VLLWLNNIKQTTQILRQLSQQPQPVHAVTDAIASLTANPALVAKMAQPVVAQEALLANATNQHQTHKLKTKILCFKQRIFVYDF